MDTNLEKSNRENILLLVIPNLILWGLLFFQIGIACENFIAYLVYFVLCGSSLIFITIFALVGMRAGKQGRSLAIVPAIILLAYLLLPIFWNIRSSIEFVIRKPGYTEVVRKAQRGEYFTNSSNSLADIDDAHSYLCPCDKEIGIENDNGRLLVLFFTSNRLLGEFSGYLYSSDGQEPNIKDFRELRALRPNEWALIKRVDANWFYVAYDH